MPTRPQDEKFRPSSGHLLWQRLLQKHKRDRFPTVSLNLLQLGSEVGELQGAWAKALDRQDVEPVERLEAARTDPKVLKELGDAGLALYAVASKLGIDLIDAMAQVAANETRSFE
jgi:NTP pyrophosphatase (non-canonical NTP hydrolase)